MTNHLIYLSASCHFFECLTAYLGYASNRKFNFSKFSKFFSKFRLGIGGILCCFLPFWVSFLIVLVLTATAALLIPSQYSVCWARMLSIFCLLPIMMKFLGFELLTVGLPTAFFNVGFCLFLSYLSGPVLLELIFVTYLYQK